MMKAIQIIMFASALFTSAVAIAGQAAETDRTPVTVFMTPWCGCCHAWTEIMREEGFEPTVHDVEDLDPVKSQAGVPGNMQSCHTAAAGGYVLEGHVPPAAVRKLLSERPAVRGLSVPGMPAGSPGMGNDSDAHYTVYSFSHDREATPQVYLEIGK
ncbi:DUF411 domain-containing protein [Hoeflea sp.]|uniref:DUF411 domain-containing protein n=1 Tax=Hoeflea sp. TaxID=1940281 RepID=UPI003B01C220